MIFEGGSTLPPTRRLGDGCGIVAGCLEKEHIACLAGTGILREKNIRLGNGMMLFMERMGIGIDGETRWDDVLLMIFVFMDIGVRT